MPVMPTPQQKPKVASNKVARYIPRNWFVNYLPVTKGNKVDFFIKGKEYCASLFDDLSRAQDSIYLTGLHFMWDFELVRGKKESRIATVLTDAAQRGVEVFLLVNQFWMNEFEHVNGKWVLPKPDWSFLLSPLGDTFVWGEDSFVKQGIRKVISEKGSLGLYLFETMQLFKILGKHPDKIHCLTDIHPGWIMHSNHQKTIVIDHKTAYLGGIDLTYIDGDRWDDLHNEIDTRAHGGYRNYVDRSGKFLDQKFWHDIHLRIVGSDALTVMVNNFQARWNAGNLHRLREEGKRGDNSYRIVADPVDKSKTDFPALVGPLPNPFTEKNYYGKPMASVNAKIYEETHVQIVRSMPNKAFGYQKPPWNESKDDFEKSCRESYINGIGAARKYIYLENQWIADKQIWKALLQAAKTATASLLSGETIFSPNFKIILMLPAEPLVAAGLGADQTLFLGGHISDILDVFHEYKTKLKKKEIPGILEMDPEARKEIDDEKLFGVFCMKSDWVMPDTSNAHREEQGRWKLHEDSIWENQVYVHSKMLIVDDQWIMVGSANGGGISLTGVLREDRPDTELSAVVFEPKSDNIKKFRKKLWASHLQVGEAALDDPLKAGRKFWEAASQEYTSNKKRTRFFEDFCKKYKPSECIVSNLPKELKECRIIPVRKWVVNFDNDAGTSYTRLEIGFKTVLPNLPDQKAWLAWELNIYNPDGIFFWEESSIKHKGMDGTVEGGYGSLSETFLPESHIKCILKHKNSNFIFAVMLRIALCKHPAPWDVSWTLNNVAEVKLNFRVQELANYLEKGVVPHGIAPS